MQYFKFTQHPVVCIRILALTALSTFFLQHINASGDSTLVDLQRLNGQVTIDGVINETAWESILPLKMVQHIPDNGKDAITQARIRVGYDDNFLYLAAICKSDKKYRSATTFKRDALAPSMDHVALVLDTYNDNENALIFAVTPTGSRVDLTMVNDASAGEISSTWDSFWDAEVTEDDETWYLEMRIPFSSLKFQSINNEVTMGMTVYNYIANGSKMDTYPEISDKWGFWSFAKSSQAQKVHFTNIKSARPLYVSPYVLGGLEHQSIINDESTDYSTDNSNDFEVGLDVKYAVSDNLTLDVTVNTDFAQVEADDAQVNLTRFSLFFPEKRKFFLERESNFNFKFGGVDQLFYSRRIGLYGNELVRILGGARLVGRAGKWDLGMMDLQTGKSQDIPSENFGVFRFRRQVFNSYSYLGGIVTSRLSADGHYNVGYGLDGIVRVVGDEYMSYNLAQTVDDKLNGSISGFDASRISLAWERRTFEGLSYNVDFDYGGRNYKPGLGFQTRNNFTRYGSSLAYGWIPDETSSIQRLQVRLSGATFLRNKDHKVESVELGSSINIASKSSANMGANLSFFQEDLVDTFYLTGNVTVDPGQYNFVGFGIYYNTPQSKSLRSSLNVNGGGFYDGTRISVGIGPVWNISRFFELSGFYQFNKVTFRSRKQEFTAQIARFKVLVTLNTKIAASSYVQYNSLSKSSIINFRLRYNPRDGNDLYLVYNENSDISRMDYDFKVPLSTYRAVLIKYVHTFRF